ncbi:SGNH/GDSL hydrolase family protein [Blastococcus sp. SYSU DS0533]
MAGNVAVFSAMALSPEPADPYGGSRVTESSIPSPARPTPSAGTDDLPPVEQEAAPVLAVYGDGYAAGNESGGLGPAGWPAIVAQRVGAELQLNAVSRSGYAAAGATGQDFLDLVESTPVPDADVTLLFGSRNDLDESPAVVRENATAAIAAAQSQAPDTSVVVIGPVWDDGDVPDALLAVRDAVQAAARAVGVPFVDPLAAGWFAEQTGFIAADGVSPNDQGHVYLADRVTPLVQTAVAQADPPA